MVETPRTRYAQSGDVCVAYQLVGEGPLDVVFIPDWRHHVEAQWEDPSLARALRRLGGFARLIVFDKRGTGLSDPVPVGALPSLEEWMDDVRLLLDAVGSERAALIGQGGGGLMAVLFAATYPARTHSLVLINAFARLSRTEGYPFGFAVEDQDFLVKRPGLWGTGGHAEMICPSVAGQAPAREWFARMQRLSTSPSIAAAMQRVLFALDTRAVLPTLAVPTLVIAISGDRYVESGHGRYLAEHIPGARYVELRGRDHYWWYENGEPILDEIEEFLTGSRMSAVTDRVLATVLFTDIVGSTEHVVSIGDRGWTDLLEHHDAVVARQVARFGGRRVKNTGDGILATFDGPGRAIRCGCAIRDALNGLGIEGRVGVHAGEIELRDDDVAGVAVHIASRVMNVAVANEVLVSSTVRDLVAGSGIEFLDRGELELKGVPRAWRLFLVRG